MISSILKAVIPFPVAALLGIDSDPSADEFKTAPNTPREQAGDGSDNEALEAEGPKGVEHTLNPSRVSIHLESLQSWGWSSETESISRQQSWVGKPRVRSDRKVSVTGETLHLSGQPPLLGSHTGTAEAPQVPIISFKASKYIAAEGESSIVLVAERRGPMDTALAMEWFNENRSTHPDSFVSQGGVLCFREGQREAEIDLRLKDDEVWNIEATQIVTLRLPATTSKGMQAAMLVEPSAATVVVVNDDAFPHGLADESTDDKILVVSRYIKHLRNLMKSETSWGIFYKSYDGIKSVADQVILLMLLNIALKDTQESNIANMFELISVLAIYIVNFAIKNLMDHLFIKLRLGGKANINLRMAVTATAMQFTKEERARFPPGKIARVVESDVQLANDTVWASSFQLVSLMSKLVCSLLYLTYLNLSHLNEVGLPFAILLTVIPLVIYASDIVVMIRTYHKGAQIAYDAGEAGDRVISYGAEIASLHQTIQDSDKAQSCMEKYWSLHAIVNDILVDGIAHSDRAEYTARWISTLLSACLFGLTGWFVITRGYAVANFVTLYNSMMSFSAALTGIFDVSFRILSGYGPVMKLREVLNADTHHKELLRFSRQQRELLTALQNDPSAMRPIRDNELRLQGVVYSFDKQAEVFPALSFGIEPGQVVALHSPPSFGARTILKLVARHIVPSEGLIWYPSSWRVCYVDSKPNLFDDTLMANLRFREVHKHSDEEIWALCRLFGLNEDLIGKGDMMVGCGGINLSSSDCVMVSLLSGMLSSPDLILLPGVLDGLGEELAVRIVSILRDFTRTRRLECLVSENARLDASIDKDKLVLLSTKLCMIRDSADTTVRLSSCLAPPQGMSAAELPASPC